MKKNVISIIDGAAGSCGKGKVIGELVTSKELTVNAAVTNCMPNAGHTVFVDKKRIFKNIPASIVNTDTKLFIGPGSVIDYDDFVKEYEENSDILGDRKIYVHQMTPVVNFGHKIIEREKLKSGSTFKGSGAALADKVMRCSEFFQGYKNAVVLSNENWLELLYEELEKNEGYVLLEGAQGCDLSINHSGNYPYTTSRNVSTMQMLADSAICAERLYKTIMVIRPFPIRISNVTNAGEYISTGGYGNGSELTWSHINFASKYAMYPTLDLFEEKGLIKNLRILKKYINGLSKESLMQIFKNKSFNINEISFEEMLEVERLYFKKIGINSYYSVFLLDYVIDQSENTTVTNMERRIFDLDINKLKMNSLINNPSGLYLNFFQHLDYNFFESSGNYDEYYYSKYVRDYLSWLENETNAQLVSLGTGAKNKERIRIKSWI